MCVWGGGGKYYSAPSRIFSIAQKWHQISTQRFSNLMGHQLALRTKSSEKSVENVLRKWCLSDVMFRQFWSKSDKCLNVYRMYRLEVKRNQKTLKVVKLNAFQNGHLRFLIFFYFHPQLKISIFLKKWMPFKPKILEQWNPDYMLESNIQATYIQFQSDISIFGFAMVKTVKCDDINFNAYFGIYKCCT